MQAIRITVRTPKPAVLPIAYNELIHGLLYSCWWDAFPELHDGKSKPFTFSQLYGGKPNPKKKEYVIRDIASFEVRSPISALIEELAKRLMSQASIRIGAYDMDLVNLQACDRFIFPKRPVIKTTAPIIAHRTKDDGKTLFYGPDDDEWLELIRLNAQHKADRFSLPFSQNLMITPRRDPEKIRTTFKGTRINGWMGEFAVSADPMLIGLLYYLGLGAKNSQGFGMFTVVDKLS